LSLPAPEMLEVLVELTSNPLFSEQAALTLAAWDEDSAREVLSDASAPAAVLEFFSSPNNVRTTLLPALLENPSVSELSLEKLAAGHSAEVLSIMVQSSRVSRSPKLLDLLSHDRPMPSHLAQQGLEELPANEGTVIFHSFDLLDVQQYFIEHQDEIEVAEKEPFHLIGGTIEETAELAVASEGGRIVSAAGEAMAQIEEEKEERVTPLQRIARMTVGQRVMTALKGSRDDRFLLIRDGARVVTQAVLDSPKLNEQEVEAYAGMRNVSENVLRAIAMRRKWIKHYGIVRALTRNPRTPVDVSLPLMKGLQMTDLKSLAGNKDIPDAARKIAFKMMRERMQERNK
jgi:hypothetical protein